MDGTMKAPSKGNVGVSECITVYAAQYSTSVSIPQTIHKKTQMKVRETDEQKTVAHMIRTIPIASPWHDISENAVAFSI